MFNFSNTGAWNLRAIWPLLWPRAVNSSPFLYFPSNTGTLLLKVVARRLKQPRYLIQVCDDLVVVTDHKPLTKILDNRTLDEINNSRIFRLKQRRPPWYFKVAHLPGKTNAADDATSRHPSQSEYAELTILILCSGMDSAECPVIAAVRRDASTFTALCWDRAHGHGDVIRSWHVPAHGGH